MGETIKLGAGVFSLAGVGGHIVIGVTDQQNRVVEEFNGLSTGPDGNAKAMGFPWERDDTIKAYYGVTGMYAKSAYRVELGEFTPEEYQTIREKMFSTMDVINSQNLDYKMMSQNSNSVARTLLEAIGLAPPLAKLNELAIPGYNNILADPDFIEDMVQRCFLAGTSISMWDGTEKPIEFVKPGDVVVSYDQDGKLVPGRVSKTKENRVKYILDVFGLMVTPGHVTLCGDGKFEGQHVPIIDILRSDSALVLEDGSMKRAATNFAVGSIEDRFVQAIVTEDVPGTDSVRVVESGQIRLGTRFMHPTGADITVLEIIQRTGGSLTDDGYVVLSDGITKTRFVWTFTNRLPKPEDFVLQRSQVTLADIYEADEWEAVAPQVPSPYRGEAGPSFASINGGLKAPGQEDNRPPNIPVSMRGSANQPTMSRKQRRAHEAKQRKQAKRMVRTAH